MKKRILTLFLAMIICFCGIINWNVEVRAENMGDDIELSEIMTGDALVGYAENQTWGVYFSDGYSIINKISSTKIGAGGVTNANVKCTVKVNAIVEKKNSSGNWERVTSWSVTNQNAYSATSFTSALWVGN